MKNKLPTLVSPIAPDLRRFLDRMREAFESPEGLLTRSDLIQTGAFQENTTGGLDFLEPGEALSCIAPPAALNLEATGAMTSIILTWDNEPYASTPCYAYAEVWRASSNSLGSSVLIGTTSSSMYADAVGSDASNYYWIRFVNVLNDKGPFVTAGVAGATSPDVAYLLNQLTTSITNGQLASTLASSINSTFHQASHPTTKVDGTTLVAGDTWLDSNDLNKLYLYDPSATAGPIHDADSGASAGDWIDARDADIATALSNAATAQETADGVIVGFYQDTEPTDANSDPDPAFGDIWIKTDTTLVDGKLPASSISRYQNSSGGSSGDLDWEDSLTSAIGLLYLDAFNATADIAANRDTYDSFVSATGIDFTAIQGQIDGSITTWFDNEVPTLLNVPYSTWTTDALKVKHLGDVYYDNTSGYAYRFTSDGAATPTYSWIRITDNDMVTALENASTAQDTADGKRRVFVVTPTPPYDIGDLWVEGSLGDIKKCKTDKASNASYSIDDWEVASKYTDDTEAKLKVTSFYKDSTATPNEIPTALAIGDFWIDTGDNDKVYRAKVVGADAIDDEEWVALEIATQAYVGTEITQQVGYCERTITTGENTGDTNVATAYTTKATCEAASVSGESFSWKDDTALAGEVKTVTTTVGGHTTTIGVQSSSISGIEGKHTVKIDNNGYVTGYGLISTANNGTPTSEFAIVADQFSIAPVNTDNTATDRSPFFHRTSSTTINGVSIPAGTYMKGAFIHDATITTAKIGALAVDDAKIADAAIVTAKIDNLAVTNAKINDLDASKITTGYLAAGIIEAGTITSDHIGSNTITASNLIVSGTGAIVASTIGALKSFYQNNIPTSLAIGDLWVDTDDGNKLYRAAAVGATTITLYDADPVGWVTVQDGTIATAQLAAVAAQGTATNAATAATAAQGELDDIASDSIITPVEKVQAKTLWDAVYTEYLGIVASAAGLSVPVSSTAYTTKYNALNTYLNTTNAVFADMDNNTTIGAELSFGSAYVFNASVKPGASIAFDPSNANKFVAAYSENTGLDGYAVVGTISGTTISYGTPVRFHTSAGTFDGVSGNISVAFDPNTANKFVIAYQEYHAAGSEYSNVIVGDISGTTISYGSEYPFHTYTTNDISVAFDPNTAGKFVVVYDGYTGGSHKGRARVGTISSSTVIAYGTEAIFKSSETTNNSLSFDPNTANKFVVTSIQKNSYDGYARVGTISSTTISFGTDALFNSTTLTSTSVAFNPSIANKFVIAYTRYDNAGNFGAGKAIAGTVSGTTITFGTEVNFTEVGEETELATIAFDSTITDTFVITYTDADNSDHGTAVIGTVSDTALSFSTEIVYNAAASSNSLVRFDSNSSPKFIVAYGNAVRTGSLSGRTLWNNNWSDYYGGKQALLDAIAAELNSISETIKGNVYYSGTTEIDGGNIRADTIDINEITVTPSDVGVGTASGDDSMRISSTKIEIYNGGVLRVKLGYLGT